MAFEDREFSLFNSQPVEFYRFEMNNKVWFFNPTKNQETLYGEVYEPTMLKRTKFRQNKESVTDVSLDLTVRRENPIAQLFKIIVPERTVWLTVYRKHRGAPDDEAKVIWTGRVRGASWGPSTAKLRAEPLSTLVKRGGLRMNYQIPCNHFLYSPSCGVNQSQFQVNATVSNIVGSDVYSPQFAGFESQYFRLGFIEIGGYFYMIIDHVGSRVTLFNQLEGVKSADEVLIYPGCDKHIDTCHDKFDNRVNYGGFHWSPQDNPFEVGIGF